MSKKRLCPWLEAKLNSGEIPGLEWLNEEKTLFRILWKHGGKQEWNEKDAAVFKAWALHTGKYSEGVDEKQYATWKTRLRCAINKSEDIVERKDLSNTAIEEAYKVFEFRYNRDHVVTGVKIEHQPMASAAAPGIPLAVGGAAASRTGLVKSEPFATEDEEPSLDSDLRTLDTDELKKLTSGINFGDIQSSDLNDNLDQYIGNDGAAHPDDMDIVMNSLGTQPPQSFTADALQPDAIPAHHLPHSTPVPTHAAVSTPPHLSSTTSAVSAAVGGAAASATVYQSPPAALLLSPASVMAPDSPERPTMDIPEFTDPSAPANTQIPSDPSEQVLRNVESCIQVDVSYSGGTVTSVTTKKPLLVFSSSSTPDLQKWSYELGQLQCATPDLLDLPLPENFVAPGSQKYKDTESALEQMRDGLLLYANQGDIYVMRKSRTRPVYLEFGKPKAVEKNKCIKIYNYQQSFGNCFSKSSIKVRMSLGSNIEQTTEDSDLLILLSIVSVKARTKNQLSSANDEVLMSQTFNTLHKDFASALPSINN